MLYQRDILALKGSFFSFVLVNNNSINPKFLSGILLFFLFLSCQFTTVYATVDCVESLGSDPADKRTIILDLWEYPRIPDPDDPTDRFSWLRNLISQFEADNPEIKVRVTELTWAQGSDKLKISVLAGHMPDITSGAVPLQFIDFGVIEPVDDYLTEKDLEDYFPVSLESFEYRGSIWGFPWAQKGDLLFLNLDLFRAKGIKPPADGRWSWHEFVDTAHKLTGYKENGERVWGASWAFSPVGATETYGLLLAGGGDFFIGDPLHFGFNQEPALDSINAMLSLSSKEGPAPPDCGGYQSKDVWLAFCERGTVAMAPFGLWGVQGLRKSAGFEFGIAGFPDRPDGNPASLTGTVGYYVFRQTDPRKRKAAMDLARFITNGENQRLLAHYSQFPTRKSTGDIYRDDPIMSFASHLVARGRPEPKHSKWAMMDDIIKRRLQEAALGTVSLEKAMDSAAKTIDGILMAQASNRISTQDEKGAFGNSGAIIFALFITVLLILFAYYLYRNQMALATNIYRQRHNYIFLLPAMSVFIIFMVWPVFRAFLLAFQEFGMDRGLFEGWVGLGNFSSVFADDSFAKCSINTAIYTILVVPATVFSALVLASLIYPLSEKLSHFFRAAFYLPGVASVVVMAMVWRWLFDVQYGFLNKLLVAVGLSGIDWLTSPDWSLYSIALSTILRGPGGALIIYLAAMTSISSSLYEAASIDGAGALKRWWNITVPMLAPTTLFLVITQTISSFQVFAQVLMMTDGGPGDSSSVLVHRIYTMAFRDLDIGPASAMALILFLFIVTVSIIQFKFFKGGWEGN